MSFVKCGSLLDGVFAVYKKHKDEDKHAPTRKSATGCANIVTS